MSVLPIWATPEYREKLAFARTKYPLSDLPPQAAFDAGFREGWERAVDTLLEGFNRLKEKEEKNNGK